VFDTSEADAKAAVAAAAAAAERAAPPKLLERLLSGCVIGAGWDEDESLHGVHGGRLYWDACVEPAREDSHAGFAESTGGAVLSDTLAQARAQGGPREMRPVLSPSTSASLCTRLFDRSGAVHEVWCSRGRWCCSQHNSPASYWLLQPAVIRQAVVVRVAALSARVLRRCAHLQAVEELSGSRIAEAGRRWRDERAVAAPPKACLPIEAPRARRVYNCSIGAPSALIMKLRVLSTRRCFLNRTGLLLLSVSLS
jgi:hypothetical protein